MNQITIERGTFEFERLEKNYMPRRTLSRIVNKSDVWIQKRFIKPFEKSDAVLKVKVMAPLKLENGEEVLARENAYIYIEKKNN